MYQALSPSSCIRAGTRIIRTRSASTRIAIPSPTPKALTVRSSLSTKAQKTTPMMIPAATMTLPIAPTPVRTAASADPVRTYSSRIRLTRKTS